MLKPRGGDGKGGTSFTDFPLKMKTNPVLVKVSIDADLAGGVDSISRGCGRRWTRLRR